MCITQAPHVSRGSATTSNRDTALKASCPAVRGNVRCRSMAGFWSAAPYHPVSSSPGSVWPSRDGRRTRSDTGRSTRALARPERQLASTAGRSRASTFTQPGAPDAVSAALLSSLDEIRRRDRIVVRQVCHRPFPLVVRDHQAAGSTPIPPLGPSARHARQARRVSDRRVPGRPQVEPLQFARQRTRHALAQDGVVEGDDRADEVLLPEVEIQLSPALDDDEHAEQREDPRQPTS